MKRNSKELENTVLNFKNGIMEYLCRSDQHYVEVEGFGRVHVLPKHPEFYGCTSNEIIAKAIDLAIEGKSDVKHSYCYIEDGMYVMYNRKAVNHGVSHPSLLLNEEDLKEVGTPKVYMTKEIWYADEMDSLEILNSQELETLFRNGFYVRRCNSRGAIHLFIVAGCLEQTLKAELDSVDQENFTELSRADVEIHIVNLEALFSMVMYKQNLREAENEAEEDFFEDGSDDFFEDDELENEEERED
jgi:hypothetical protein